MKQLFSIALLAAAVTFTSCGGDKSLSGRAASAMCGCSAVKEMVAIATEMEKADDAKKMELMPKMMEVAPKVEECIKPLKEEADKLQGADKEKFEAELKEKMTKTCPDIANALNKK